MSLIYWTSTQACSPNSRNVRWPRVAHTSSASGRVRRGGVDLAERANYAVVVIGSGPGGYGVAMRLEGTALDFSHTIHRHPTLAEAVLEAAHAVEGKAIHI
jgi:hypothetical protein